ncbi:MAG: 3-hydroxyacyl-CoA dehydrogenase NAD-binding domain-containing protein [Halopseudomonas sp.]|uniref:3-hydroxyacyl-CoA dehydrogenase NAD-binding domain-containing protein n=1 Tax=Halopseudomonas sp. TaxID=2901191 RepID=UPI0030014C7C
MNAPVLEALAPRRMELGPFSVGELKSGSRQWQHWHLKRDEQNVAWLLMDKADSSANVLSEAVLRELSQVIAALKSDMPTALVIRSAKPGSFCVGADIKEFRQLKTEPDVINQLVEAHLLAQQLVDLDCPTIAIIHGAALGGGLELALCCDYRLAVKGATFGVPEVLLGLHPGLGGTARLPDLIDPLVAMEMMLTGRTIHDAQASKLGLIDQLLEERHLRNAVAAVLNDQVAVDRSNLRARPFRLDWVRRLAAWRMRKQADSKAPPQHYPAPHALIKLWQRHGNSPDQALHREIYSFAHLLNTPTSRNLVRVFFLREQLKALGDPGKGMHKPAPVLHVHVIGAGAMGADIAAWCALQGLRVSLFDTQAKTIGAAVQKLAALCQKKHRSPAQTRDILDNLIPDPNNCGVAVADLVLEAVPEDLEIKRKVYAEVEPRMKRDAILATNTSSIALEKLREGLADAGRLVGIHFFNPVAQMQLVEVVAHSTARSSAVERATTFVGQINRLPAPVASAPGFLVNRALTPYLVEAICLLDEGLSAEAIDQVAIDFGMPMGPLELADQVGLDICVGVADMLREQLDNKLPETPDWLRKKVEKDELGRKSGKGIYRWKHGEVQKKHRRKQAPRGTQERLLLPMLNACMACLREQVIDDADQLDGAMIFATGFPPFRGGPMHYAGQLGFDTVAAQLQELSDKHGPRFAPDPGWTTTSDE